MGDQINARLEEEAAQAGAAALAEVPAVAPGFLGAVQGAADQFLNADPATGVLRGAGFEGISQGQQAGFVDPIAENARFLGRFGRGEINDPRFEQSRERQLATTQGFFNRRGLGNSSAALNAIGRTEENIAGQDFGARQQALGQSAGLFGQAQQLTLGGIGSRNVALSERLSSLSAGIETLTIPQQLEIARIAAANAGQSSGGGGGGGGGGIFGK